MILALRSDLPVRMVKKQIRENGSILNRDQWTKSLKKVSSKIYLYILVYNPFYPHSELLTASRPVLRLGWPRHEALCLQDYAPDGCGQRFDAGKIFVNLSNRNVSAQFTTACCVPDP